MKDTLPYLDGGLTCRPELFCLECKRFYVISMIKEEGAYPSRRGISVIDRKLC
jgi:hypothetical protein